MLSEEFCVVVFLIIIKLISIAGKVVWRHERRQCGQRKFHFAWKSCKIYCKFSCGESGVWYGNKKL